MKKENFEGNKKKQTKQNEAKKLSETKQKEAKNNCFSFAKGSETVSVSLRFASKQKNVRSKNGTPYLGTILYCTVGWVDF